MQGALKIKAMVYCCWLLLIIGCGGGGSDEDTNNSPPVANAGNDQTVSVSDASTQTVTLSGADSDSDGTITTRQWTQTAGTTISISNANSATATFSVDATEQTYTFSYTVTDDEGATASDEINITVIINETPTAEAGEDQSISLNSSETRTVTLSGTDSDSDGEIVTRQWEQTTGSAVTLSNATTSTATVTVGSTAQTYTFTYTVTDDDGATATDEVSVSVVLNSLPVVDAGTYDIYSDSQTVTLTGSAADSDGSITAHQWTQTGGSSTLSLSEDTTQSVSFTVPDMTATYTFSYTATDDDGGQATDTTTIYVVSSIFTDEFDDGSAWSSRWTLLNGAWIQFGEQLLQTSDITNFSESPTDNTTESYHLGTYAHLSDPSAAEIPADYRFSVDITPSTNLTGSFQGNDVGIMFRYQDDNNYYRVSMNARYGFTRFERRNGGSFTTLAVNSIGYIENQTINMTVEIQGNNIVVWIDGVPVFAIADDAPIASGTIALYGQDRVLFDNVRITEPSTKPTVAIATPLAYTVALTADDSDTLAVEAVVLNPPTGGTVGFVLDDQDEVSVSSTDSNGYYTTPYTAVADGDHEIMAVLRDADGQSVASDINSTVGVGGNYYVAIGDSITNGVGDDDNSNNESADGRIVARQGFEAPLADLLTDATGVPNIAFNEGIGGQVSSELVFRIDSILERHPSANGYLLMIGTNDSGYSVSSETYQPIMEQITGAIDDTAGVWLARMMPTYENDSPISWTRDSARNAYISAYNVDCNEIADASDADDIFRGPNFYQGLFVDDPSAVYDDYLHPNDNGYQDMAEAWSAILAP